MARILVCDDSLFMRMLLKKALTDQGHEVVAEAEDGRKAVELYQRCQPDLVTMDITMPSVDGIKAAQLILAGDAAARIIMVTAICQQAVRDEAMAAGAAGFIVKPFDALQIKETVERVLHN
ncbi:MAG: response regulator [Sporomusaceae bacterium]|nr:response regulator [Sporomusaceae bacterium]